jgi:hypothetical protein
MGFVMPIQTHGLYLIEFKALYTVFPFQGGEEISGEELERYAINALEQTVVAVGMDGSKVLTPTSASTTSNAAGELSNRA